MQLGSQFLGQFHEGQARLARIGQFLAEPVGPQPSVGSEHHLGDRGIVQPHRNLVAERRATHPDAARGNVSDVAGLTLMNCLVDAGHPVIGCACEADQRDIEQVLDNWILAASQAGVKPESRCGHRSN